MTRPPQKADPPDCDICTLDWPSNPNDPEFFDVRVLYRDHLLAIDIAAELQDHVTARSMWLHGDSSRANDEARAALDTWTLGRKEESVEDPAEWTQEPLSVNGAVAAQSPVALTSSQQFLLDNTLDRYCRMLAAQGLPPSPDVLMDLERNFREGARKANIPEKKGLLSGLT